MVNQQAVRGGIIFTASDSVLVAVRLCQPEPDADHPPYSMAMRMASPDGRWPS